MAVTAVVQHHVADLGTTLATLQTAAASDVMDHDGVLADTLVLLVETGK